MEDTPLIEDVPKEVLVSALKPQSEFERDIKILGDKINSSISVIQDQLYELQELRNLLNSRVEVENKKKEL